MRLMYKNKKRITTIMILAGRWCKGYVSKDFMSHPQLKKHINIKVKVKTKFLLGPKKKRLNSWIHLKLWAMGLLLLQN